MIQSPATTMMKLRITRTLGALVLLPLLSIACQKESESVVTIAPHPTNANILYVATNDVGYKSRDGGGTREKFPSFSARRATSRIDKGPAPHMAFSTSHSSFGVANVMRAAFSPFPVFQTRTKSAIVSFGEWTSSTTVFMVPPRYAIITRTP